MIVSVFTPVVHTLSGKRLEFRSHRSQQAEARVDGDGDGDQVIR